MKRSINGNFKEWLRKKWPNAFVATRGVKDQAMIEIRTLKTLGIGGLFASFSRNGHWRRHVPVQSVSKRVIADMEFANFNDLLRGVEITGSGAHTVYLSPQAWENSPLSILRRGYPDNAGLKLVKRMGSADDAYIGNDVSGAIQEKLLGSHRQQILVMNYLYMLGLGPKLHDLIEIDGHDATCVAYVVEHAPGDTVSEEQCRNHIGRIKELVDSKKLLLVNWFGFEDIDFVCPNCNGNLRSDADGSSVYIDTQNFRFANYGKILTEVSLQAQSVSHFGDRSHLLGGKYLYQAVPGVNLPAKRDPASRMKVLENLLVETGISLAGRTVLDVGCNMGLMGAQYLKRRAAWVHGWDMPEVVAQTEKVLRAIGCTRFSLTGTTLSSATDLAGDVPKFVRADLNRSLISYLAIRGHIGWLDALKQFPWAVMIYEGHEGEDLQQSRAFIDALSTDVPLRIRAEAEIQDGTSLRRYVAIIERA